jgi:predicted amidohydrolase
VRLALGQIAPPSCDVGGSVARCRTLCREAAAARADWLVLPELVLGGYQLSAARTIALVPNAPELQTLAREAQRLGIGLQVGFAEQEGTRLFNSALVVTPAGEQYVYRKTHLFGRESDVYTPGASLCVVAGRDPSVAPLICYDIEFPEPARTLALHGVDIITVSTANMEPYDASQALYARTRALENGIFVAIANRLGEDEGFHFFGQSIVADPFGRVVAQAGQEETLLVADCDLNLMAASRSHTDYLRERRPELGVELTRPGYQPDPGRR